VFILKEVKVVCFDTLLQVLILKSLRTQCVTRAAESLPKSKNAPEAKTPAGMLALENL
jgi:hypothetical protein